jgi:putative SOS response-associated peptidase YedK
MCGRYRLSRRKQIIEEHFGSVSREEDWSPRYNIAPTQPIPVHPPESEGARPRTIAAPLGTNSVMGKRLVCRRQDD